MLSDIVYFALLGLGDGSSPCHLIIIAFFIFFLLFKMLSGSRRIILSSLFVGAIALTSFLICLGVFEPFRQLELFSVITQTAYLFSALVAIGIGFLSARAWWMHKKGQSQPPALRLNSIEQDAAVSILERKDSLNIAAQCVSVLALGFVTAILESSCSGYVYMPSVFNLLVSKGMLAKAYGIVCIYLFMLIAPAVVLIFGTVHALNAKRILSRLKKRIALIKAINAAVFLGYGIGIVILLKI